MTNTLEDYVNEFGKGIATGFTKLADPVGWGLSYSDKSFRGAGYSNELAVDTIHNQVYKSMYKTPDENVDASSYTLRTFGNLLGLGAGAFALSTLVIPALSGIYSLIKTGKKYSHDLFRGEKERDPTNPASVIKTFDRLDAQGNRIGTYETESATFDEGFNFGWEQYTNFFPIVQDIESGLTGRGYNNSHFDSQIQETSKKARRNGKSVLGNLVGCVVGFTASILSLGILPVYKSIKDGERNFRRE